MRLVARGVMVAVGAGGLGLLGCTASAWAGASSGGEEAPSQGIVALHAGPIAAKGGYSARIDASVGVLHLTLTRVQAGTRQWHTVSYARGTELAAGTTLRHGWLRVHFGAYGEGRLHFSATSRRVRTSTHGEVRVRSRAGVLRGLLVLRLHDRSFRTLRIRSTRATLSRTRDAGTVHSGGGAAATTLRILLTGSATQHSRTTVVRVLEDRHGRVREQVTVHRYGSGLRPATTDGLSSPLSPHALTVSKDLRRASTARLRGAITGRIVFRSNGPPGHHDSFGLLSGQLRCRFDSLGTVRPFEHGPLSAVLQRV